MASALTQKSALGARVQQASGRRSVVARASRQLWLPGLAPPSHLDGSLAGDFGFDPLGLGKDPKSLVWYQQGELVNGRTAMVGVVGMLVPSILKKLGAGVPEWFDAGKVYEEQPGAIPFGTLFVTTFFFCGFVEMKRYQDIMKPGSQAEKGSFLGFEASFGGSGEVGYPGGFFDPMGLSKNNPETYAQYKIKEVKNGRLAMLAFLGFAAQHAATGKGPVDNLLEHVADPFHKTFAENGVSVPFF